MKQFSLAELSAILKEHFASCLKLETPLRQTLNANWDGGGREKVALDLDVGCVGALIESTAKSLRNSRSVNI